MKRFNKIDLNRVKSLIYLLDDEDDSIYSIAKEHLLAGWGTRLASVGRIFASR